MNAGHAHLWREWREHRRALVFLAVCLAFAAAALSTLVPMTALRGPEPVRWCAVLVAGTVLVSVGSDLFARERQRGTSAWLARLPHGLERAFAAKLAFFALLVLGTVAYGLALGYAVALARTGYLPAHVLDDLNPWSVALATLLLVWVFAASAWVKSSALSVPVAALFLALVGGPAWWMVSHAGTFGLSRASLDVQLGCFALGAVASAWVAFVRGELRRGARTSALAASLGVAALSFAPSWAWAGQKYLDLQVTTPRAVGAYLGRGERFAFVNVANELPNDPRTRFGSLEAAVLVDLETGERRTVGSSSRSTWQTPRRFNHGGGLVDGARLPYAELWDVPVLGTDFTKRWFAGDTALELDAQPEAPELLDELGWPPASRPSADEVYTAVSAGRGYCLRIHHSDDDRYRMLHWDPVTGICVDLSASLGLSAADGVLSAYVRDGCWLVQLRSAPPCWYDPATQTLERAEEIAPDDLVCGVYDDGTLLLLREGVPVRLDPVSGEVRALHVIGTASEAPRLTHLSGTSALLRSNGHEVFQASGPDYQKRAALVVLDARADTLEFLGDDTAMGSWVLARGERRTLVSDARGLLCVDRDSGERRRVLELVPDPAP
ncbi:MAG: hypothetical protein H6828_05450 [Planctomycetes bacterium]|nr:hypothetical protein [Planctomycetota bacterium]